MIMSAKAPRWAADVLSRPAPTPADILVSLEIQPRTRNSLKRFIARESQEGLWTFDRLLSIPGFGFRALADVLAGMDKGRRESRAARSEPNLTTAHTFLDEEVAELLTLRPGARRPVATPLLNRAIDLIAATLPASEGEIARRLAEAKMVRKPLDLAQIERAARFRDRPLAFAVLRRDGFVLAVPPGDLNLSATVYSLAVRAVVNWGLAMVRRIGFQANSEDLDFIIAILSAKDNFRWLDRPAGWFWFQNHKSNLVKAVDKILSVSSPVNINDLSQALFRRWAPDNVPSRKALHELCAQVPHFRVTKSGVSLASRPATHQPLNEREHTVVELFRRWGPRIEGHRLQEICETLGMACGTLGRHLRTSLFVVEPQPGVFRLIGT